MIAAAETGDRSAAEALFAALYSELHRIARRELGRRGDSVALSATTLLHEAYLSMAARHGASFPDRARFLSYAARVMRGVIIDHARSRHAVKRGGGFEITSLDNIEGPAVDEQELSDISAALDDLATADASLAQVVDLKFFCGFSFAEIAAIQATSERTAQRKWDKARIFLHGRLRSPSAF